MIVSKSKFKTFKGCPKALWLTLNKPSEAKEDPSAETRIKEGKLVGSYAKQYFPNTVDVTSFKQDGSLDISEMIKLTKQYLQKGNCTIAEASFSVDDMFCSVDLLHPVDGGYEIYEVKSSTKTKDDHYIDVAFQKYVLEKAGLNIVNVFVLRIDTSYVRHGAIDVQQLFAADDVRFKSEYQTALAGIKNDLAELDRIVKKTDEPLVLLSGECKDCPFHDYCHKGVPVPSVINLRGKKGFDRYELYYKGVVSYQDVLNSGVKLDTFQKRQIESYLNNKTVVVDKVKVKQFLTKITYPVYHLDFETVKSPIPLCDNCHPYDQIPSQYSLHIEYDDGRPLEHKERLGDTADPRRMIAESLCNDIPEDACVLAFNSSFEKKCLESLAELFKDLRDHLLSIANNLVDLAIPFGKGYYYHKDMENRYTIKYVLPALCPNDPELDYHSLPLVHNGQEAIDYYLEMLNASQPRRDEIRDGLLKYCCLDTLAMVKVLEKIRDAAK